MSITAYMIIDGTDAALNAEQSVVHGPVDEEVPFGPDEEPPLLVPDEVPLLVPDDEPPDDYEDCNGGPV